MIGAGDSAISQIGPKHYAQTSWNATKELFRQIQQKAPVLYHCCGDNSRVDGEGRDMLKLIAETGCKVLDLDFQMDLGHARERLGETITLRGNVNTQVLGSPTYGLNEVKEEVLRVLEVGRRSKRYLFAAGCEWPWAPVEMAIRNLALSKGLVERTPFL